MRIVGEDFEKGEADGTAYALRVLQVLVAACRDVAPDPVPVP